ncbi:MAG: hypothetical protein GWP91_20130 [Rhodobacterales bacterium]|nr:hypothetical protein [Rhodobacterales bacterium]
MDVNLGIVTIPIYEDKSCLIWTPVVGTEATPYPYRTHDPWCLHRRLRR